MWYPDKFHVHFQIKLGTTVPTSGRQAVAKFLQERDIPELVFPDWWSWQWEIVDKDRGYQGSFPKRASKLRHAISGKWLSEKDQSDLGELVKRYLKDGGQSYWFDFDHKLDWLKGSFGDPGSCFVHKGSEYLASLREHRAFAFRRWDQVAGVAEADEECEEGSGDGEPVEFVQAGYRGRGRCWVMPVGETLALFNVYDYDKLSLTTYVQALAEYLGEDHWESKNVTTNAGFYTNGGTAMLLGSAEAIKALPREYHYVALT